MRSLKWYVDTIGTKGKNGGTAYPVVGKLVGFLVTSMDFMSKQNNVLEAINNGARLVKSLKEMSVKVPGMMCLRVFKGGTGPPLERADQRIQLHSCGLWVRLIFGRKRFL